MTEPRAYTADEVQQMLLDHVRETAKYWAELPDTECATGGKMTIQDRCEGVAFSILSILDGCSMNIPAFDLVLSPHESDKANCMKNGENWFEPGMTIDVMLHEHFYKSK